MTLWYICEVSVLVTVIITLGLAEQQGECDTYILHKYSSGIVDTNLFVSRGCVPEYVTTIQKSCCDTAAEVIADPCVAYGIKFYGLEDENYGPSVHMLLTVVEKCGLEVSVGYSNATQDCGDGVLSGAELCDDGNNIDDDGCTSCFVDPTFSCLHYNDSSVIAPYGNKTAPHSTPSSTLPLSSTNNTVTPASECYHCHEDCLVLIREVCLEPGFPCGPCMEGFVENERGECVQSKRVLYVAINLRNEGTDGGFGSSAAGNVTAPGCVYHDVGWTLEPRWDPSAESYLGVVREWMADRAQLAEAGVTQCPLVRAVKDAPQEENVVLVVELFVPESVAGELEIGREVSTTVVIFSEVDPRAYVVGNNLKCFNVFMYSALFFSSVGIGGCRSYEGAVALSFGTLVMENVVIEYSGETLLLDFPVFECEGIVLRSTGYLVLRNVVIQNNEINPFDSTSAHHCMTNRPTLMSLTYRVEMTNVTFYNNTAKDSVVHIKTTTPDSYFRDVAFYDNVSERPVFLVEMGFTIQGLKASGNIGAMGAVLQLSGVNDVQDLEVVDNHAVDDAGIIQNLGVTRIRNAVISRNGAPGAGWGGTILNRGKLELENVWMEENQIGAIRSNTFTHLISSTFRRNVASQYYSTVYNLQHIVVDGCVFEAAPGDDAPLILSDSLVILRDSFLPAGAVVPYAECGTSIAVPDSNDVYPCGIQAVCSPADGAGVHCECPRGYVGSPHATCGPLARVHVLPDTAVVKFTTKDGGPADVETLGLISDGLGVVTWRVVEETLPSWLSVSPISGSFINSGLCLSELIDLHITFFTGGIRGNDTEHFSTVFVETSAAFEGSQTFNSTVLSVHMSVDVLANATHSVLRSRPNCESPECNAVAGSEVVVIVDTFDSEGLRLGAGGKSIGVRVLPPSAFEETTWSDASSLVLGSLTDHYNGSYTFTFTAPKQNFVVVADIDGAAVSGSPLSYSVSCAEGEEWDSAAAMCVAVDFDIPKDIVALGAVSAFVCATAFIVSMQRRQSMVLEAVVLQKEATTTMSWIFLDLVDIGTDIGAYHSVVKSESLVSYAPWYLAALCVAVLFSLYSLRGRVHALTTIMSDSSASNASKSCDVLSHPIPITGVNGISQISTAQDLYFVTRQLQRKFRAHVLSIVGLVVQDVPMQVLNTIMICNSGSDYPVEVLLSTEVTCVLIGAKLTKIAGVGRIRDNIRRINLKAVGRGLKPL